MNSDQTQKQIRNFADQKYKYGFVGGNFRLDALQAAILSVKLPHLDDQHSIRQKNADFYNSNFNSDIILLEKHVRSNLLPSDDTKICHIVRHTI